MKVVRLIARSTQDQLKINIAEKYSLFSVSAQHARLDTGDWLSLTRQGLSPCKMLQASLVALMPRLARSVFANIPHHITQRGNRHENVFFTDEDRQIYLEWLQFYCEKYSVSILAYCLMTNHVHLVLTPDSVNGLQQVLKPLHMRYSQHINKIKGWKGHLWQGRFFSSPLDDAYTWSTIRYVERNPVQAGMIMKPEDYRWSSAAAHCGLEESSLLAKLPSSMDGVSQDNWSDWLAVSENRDVTNIIQRNIEKGLPCGNDSFIDILERVAKRSLRYKPQGRPFKENKG